jgi:hypothetical protein
VYIQIYCPLDQGLLSICTDGPLSYILTENKSIRTVVLCHTCSLKIRAYIRLERWKLKFCLKAFWLSMRASIFCFKIGFYKVWISIKKIVFIRVLHE